MFVKLVMEQYSAENELGRIEHPTVCSLCFVLRVETWMLI